MAVFGETFSSEIFAAGLGGLPFAWDHISGNITGREDLTAAQNTTLDAVIAAHDPTATLPIDKTSTLTLEEIEELIVAGTLNAGAVAAKKNARI